MAARSTSTPPQGNNDGGVTADQSDSPRTVVEADPTVTAPLVSKANPEGDPNKNTGPVGDAEVIDAQEHVLGDDPRRVAAQVGGFHDSLSGRPIDADGNYTDRGAVGSIGEEQVPPHRRVANDWGTSREKINDPANRVK